MGGGVGDGQPLTAASLTVVATAGSPGKMKMCSMAVHRPLLVLLAWLHSEVGCCRESLTARLRWPRRGGSPLGLVG